jgi:hypothetical protein
MRPPAETAVFRFRELISEDNPVTELLVWWQRSPSHRVDHASHIETSTGRTGVVVERHVLSGFRVPKRLQRSMRWREGDELISRLKKPTVRGSGRGSGIPPLAFVVYRGDGRGADTVKTPLSGASSVPIDRPYLFELAARGPEGLAHVLRIYGEERCSR